MSELKDINQISRECFAEKDGHKTLYRPNELSVNHKRYHVDIHWDFIKAVEVYATSKEEAGNIVYNLLDHDRIPLSEFEDGGFELNLDFQPYIDGGYD